MQKILMKEKYQFLVNKRESIGLKYFNNPKAIVKYWNDMQDVYKNIEECKVSKKRKTLIVCDDMIADMTNNKKFIQLQLNCLLEAEN